VQWNHNALQKLKIRSTNTVYNILVCIIVFMACVQRPPVDTWLYLLFASSTLCECEIPYVTVCLHLLYTFSGLSFMCVMSIHIIT